MVEPRDTDVGKQPQGICPMCRRPSDPVLRPFCSKRCADLDLHRWLSGSYRIETDDEPDELEDGAQTRGPPPA